MLAFIELLSVKGGRCEYVRQSTAIEAALIGHDLRYIYFSLALEFDDFHLHSKLVCDSGIGKLFFCVCVCDSGLRIALVIRKLERLV